MAPVFLNEIKGRLIQALLHLVQAEQNQWGLICINRLKACDLQKLFSVEADFEDEDFLLAVKDVEKKTMTPAPDHLRCLRPLSAGLRTPGSASVPANRPVFHSPSEPLSPVLQVQSCSNLKLGESSPLTKLKSHTMSPQVTGFGVQKDLADQCKSSCTSSPRFRFVKRQPAVLSTTGAYSDEADSELMLAACMDLEKFDAQLQRESCVQMKDNSGVTAKKPRLTNSVTVTNPVGSETEHLNGAQKENLEKTISCLQPMEASPKLFLRPTAVGTCLPQSNLERRSHMGPLANSNYLTLKSFQPFLNKPTVEPQSPGLNAIKPCASSSSTNTLLRPPKPQVPNLNTMSKMIGGGAKLLSAYGSSAPSGDGASGAPKAPCLSGNLQSPVVTNHLVRLVTAANKTPVSKAHVPLQAKTRRFPGPAGLLPQQPDGKNLEEILIATPQIPTHGALAKLQTEEITTSQQPIEDEFGRGPWAAMKTEQGLDERDPSCFLRTYSVIMVLRKAALKQLPKNKVPNMAVMVKSLMRASVDAAAVFKDPTGEMQGTIHRLLLEEKESEFKTGSVLLLKQVGVFSPSHRNHYLNVTPSNLVKIYPPGYSSEKPAQLHPESVESMETLHLQAGPEFQKDPPTSPLITIPTTVCRTQQGQEMDENCQQPTSLSLASGNCKESELNMSVPSPRSETSNGDDLDQLLEELPDEFFSSFDT